MNKKFLIISFMSIMAFYSQPSFAAGWGYNYVDGGGIYSDVSLPLDASKAVNSNENQDGFVPVANKKQEINNLKKGSSSRTNILGLVEWGDAGVFKAAKDGKISKIHYIETTREKLYVPMGFIPVYFNRFITTVYGE